MLRSVLALPLLLSLLSCEQAGDDLAIEIEHEPALLQKAAATPVWQLEAANNSETHIADLAEDAGEFPDWANASLSSRVELIEPSALPAAIKDALNRELAERAALNDASGHVGGAEFGDTPFLAIVHLGDVVGYVVSIEDFIDHPAWDGSGIHLFYDLDGSVVTTTEWSG